MTINNTAGECRECEAPIAAGAGLSSGLPEDFSPVAPSVMTASLGASALGPV